MTLFGLKYIRTYECLQPGEAKIFSGRYCRQGAKVMTGPKQLLNRTPGQHRKDCPMHSVFQYPGMILTMIPVVAFPCPPDAVQAAWLRFHVRTSALAGIPSARARPPGPAAARAARGGDPDAGGADCALEDGGAAVRTRVLDRGPVPDEFRIRV